MKKVQNFSEKTMAFGKSPNNSKKDSSGPSPRPSTARISSGASTSSNNSKGSPRRSKTSDDVASAASIAKRSSVSTDDVSGSKKRATLKPNGEGIAVKRGSVGGAGSNQQQRRLTKRGSMSGRSSITGAMEALEAEGFQVTSLPSLSLLPIPPPHMYFFLYFILSSMFFFF
jgi:hypothetical protein